MIIEIVKWDRDYHCPVDSWTEEVADDKAADKRIAELDKKPGYDFWWKEVKWRN